MDESEDCIAITHDNISSYGFLCFHYKGEPIVLDNFWNRSVEISVGDENRIQKFKIPEEYLIEISESGKIPESDHYKIGSTPASMETIKLLSERAGWNQTKEDLNSMIYHGQGGTFIASYNFQNQKIPLGSGVSFSVNTDLSWIGMILVHPELRRQGIARSIMNACLEHARLNQHKSIVGLDATPLGKQVYDSLGFKDSFAIWRSIINTGTKAINISGYGTESVILGSVKNYLEEKDATERWGIIELLNEIPGSKSIMARTSGRIKGFVMSRPGRLKPFIGPLIADSNEVALLLMQLALNYWKDLGYENVLMDIPEHHLKHSIFFDEEKTPDSTNHQIQVKPVRPFIRMYQLVADDELKEKPMDFKGLELSTSELALKKALDCYEKTSAFMAKEKQDIVPIMFGTSGPEWS